MFHNFAYFCHYGVSMYVHLQHEYKVIFTYVKTMRYSRLRGDNYKFTANVSEKDPKIT